MAKMTVAQLHDKHEALAVQVDNLSSALTEALNTIDTLTEDVDRAHDRLDKARDIIAQLSQTSTTQATRRSRPSNTAKLDGSRKHACNVPNNPHGDEQVHHTAAELNACWQTNHFANVNG